MIERDIYNKGQLIVARVSGEVKSQEIIDHVFWLIDSHNIGEIQPGYSQVVYVNNIESLNVQKDDVQRITEISTGLGQGRGKFRTAIIAVKAAEIDLASFYKSLMKDSGIEAEVCSNFEEAFSWLGCDNPDPEKYR